VHARACSYKSVQCLRERYSAGTAVRGFWNNPSAQVPARVNLKFDMEHASSLHFEMFGGGSTISYNLMPLPRRLGDKETRADRDGRRLSQQIKQVSQFRPTTRVSVSGGGEGGMPTIPQSGLSPDNHQRRRSSVPRRNVV
jgi:hypothetical protein